MAAAMLAGPVTVPAVFNSSDRKADEATGKGSKNSKDIDGYYYAT